MKKTLEKSAKTKDEAIVAALRELREINPNITENDVEIEVLEKGKAGFLGIGSVNARVSVTYTYSAEECAKAFLEGLLQRIGVEGTVDTAVEDDGTIALNVSGENMGVVIGRRGDTLNALQYITSIVVNRAEEEHVRVSVDTENYRKKREEALVTLANKVAARVLKYKKNVTLEPMNANERRVIHSALQDVRGISTYSLGSEPNRRVVVALAGARGSRRPSRPYGGARPVEPPVPQDIPSVEEE